MQKSDYLSHLRAKLSLSRWRNNHSLGKSMKNINLFITALFFAGLLAGCGKTGPLYRTPELAPVVKQQNVQSSPEIADSDTTKINANE
ncbi:MAG: putative small lipoprotein YifL [Psychromonas sp.]|jgi:predicted small lipoprotein YifL